MAKSSKMTLPSYSCYANYSNGNYGMHALVFTDPEGNDFYFSYKTLVAFRKWGDRTVVLKNYWGSTTGKHLNAIDDGDKARRLSQDDFDDMFRATFPQMTKAA